MSELRHRLEAHRNDVLAVLAELSHTARLRETFRLAGAVGHLARAQGLLMEELNELSGVSKQEPAAAEGDGEVDTPADGIRLASPKPDSPGVAKGR